MIVAGDIGGTKTLLAACEADGTCRLRRRYASRDHADFAALLAHFLDDARRALPGFAPRVACLGIAGPVLGERVKVTHLPWQIDAADLAARFGFERVLLLNDFAANAHGIDRLGAGDLLTLQAGEPLHDRPRLVIGAGTGLGVAWLIDGQVISGEAGHASFAPANAAQADLWRWLNARVGRVQVEHVVCGPGLLDIHRHLGEQPQHAGACRPQDDTAEAIAERALAGGDALARAAVELFVDCYGALAGDHALAVLARGGVYVAGGIAPQLLPRLADRFIAAFNGKDGFADAVRLCPVHVVMNPDLPLLGAARCAQQTLTAV